MTNAEFVGIRQDVYLNMVNVKYVVYEENVRTWIIHEKTLSYETSIDPSKMNKEYETYEGARIDIILNSSGEEASSITLFGDEAKCFWEYMCENYEYLGAHSKESPHVSIY